MTNCDKSHDHAADYRITCDNAIIYSCEAHAMELAGQFYAKSRTESPKFEKLNPENISIISDDVKKQMAVVNNANVGTGKADAFNTARAMADDKKLDEAGFPVVKTLFAVGTPLAQIGVDNFQRERQDFAKLADVKSGMTSLSAKVRGENREDVIVPVSSIKANDDFTFSINGTKLFVSTRDALSSLMSFTPLEMNIARYLSKCPGDLRATNMNYWLQKSKSEAKLRIREGVAGKEIFAAVTKSYTPLDVDKIADIVAQEAPPDARVEVVYNGSSARIYILFHTDVDPKNGVVGEVFKAGSMLKTDDTGGGAISGRAVAWRAICLNFTNMMTSKEVGRRKHMGSEKLLRAAVKEYLNEALDRVAPFTSAWGVAHRDNVVESAVSIDAGEVIKVSDLFGSVMGLFAGVLERELIPARGRRDEQLMHLMGSWEKEPGPMRTNIVNAITRYAHETPQRTPWDEDEFQDAASDLLFSKKPLPYVNPAKSMMEV